MNPTETALRLGWYGDDFTGATDTLAVLTQAGLRAMLFLGVPAEPQLARAAAALGGPLDAVGIAGAARSMAPAAMARELEPVGAFFARLAPPVLHYKVCSTFDSAPGIGSIGGALRTLRPHVDQAVVPVVGGQPSLGRYCAFSNLFAAAGRGGAVERLDRHPTMRQHPTTPMDEADLRRHLAAQGLEPIAALHYPAYALPDAAQDAAFAAHVAAGAQAVVLDVADPGHLAPVGRLLWQQAQAGRLLAVGASSVAQALAAHWQQCGTLAAAPAATAPLAAASGPVLVFAGSLSPVTARQVRAATSYERIALAAADLLDAGASETAGVRIRQALAAGRHVLAYTAPADAAGADTTQAAALAAASARFVRRLLDQQAAAGAPLRRVGIAGGDTSSLATQALGLWGLSYRGSLGAGVAISRTHADAPALDGIELMLKGGQMGGDEVFEQLLGR
ncbi:MULTISPECIES: four-carbon acid sugar kinase family protein [Ramlibacter]|uniref:Four-carbon acid sugar kinase family protein n=1 Tax=Ramlibacter pinisoli TaxID=2682844 RepID=A0A6N8IXL0_9BURK|nr:MULTISPECIES: four-carbon acid sugar kinase family protein [Ramlibacter]MBA2961371.1 four-carbon acid sugar kinase family protein [Ramlibacter sp. CGMCC 1.13660]MVQ31315.1 four-carbon acid sugar kinase family protein [Ramlibacter pinisoli]